MLVFLGKFEYRGIKIARVNSTHITNNINLLYFRMALVARCDVDIFKLSARAQSINSESLSQSEIFFTSMKIMFTFHVTFSH